MLLSADQSGRLRQHSLLRIEIQANSADAAIVDLDQWYKA
jgi:uncharacterized protein YggU (UPF0235/DUF167 family)